MDRNFGKLFMCLHSSFSVSTDIMLRQNEQRFYTTLIRFSKKHHLLRSERGLMYPFMLLFAPENGNFLLEDLIMVRTEKPLEGASSDYSYEKSLLEDADSGVRRILIEVLLNGLCSSSILWTTRVSVLCCFFFSIIGKIKQI